MKSIALVILSLQLFALPSFAATWVYVKDIQRMAQWKQKDGERTLIRPFVGEERWVNNSEISFEVKKGESVGPVKQGSFIMVLMQANSVASKPANLEWVDGQIAYLFEDGTALVHTNRGNFYVNVIEDSEKLSFVVPRDEATVTKVYTLRERIDHGWDAGNKVVISRLYDNGIAGIIGAGFFVKSRIKIAAVDLMVPVHSLCETPCN